MFDFNSLGQGKFDLNSNVKFVPSLKFVIVILFDRNWWGLFGYVEFKAALTRTMGDFA